MRRPVPTFGLALALVCLIASATTPWNSLTISARGSGSRRILTARHDSRVGPMVRGWIAEKLAAESTDARETD